MKTDKKLIGLSLLTAFILSGCLARPTTKVSTRATSSVNFVGVSEATKKNQPNNLWRTTKKRVPYMNNPRMSLNSPLIGKVTFGKASWYGDKFNGKKTASGELYDINKKTAAHRTLPFNTLVKVTDMVSNKSVVVRINDRGPYSKNRIIDVSRAGAEALGLINRGVTDVRIKVISIGKRDRRYSNSSLPVSTEGCVGDDCLATIVKPTQTVPSTAFKKFVINTPLISNQPMMEPIEHEILEYQNNTSQLRLKNLPEIRTFSKKTSIQVGAFRRYAGAKVYAKRYALLSNQYSVKIKEDIENAEPLYRVQIEGFNSDSEAREFMTQYGLFNGAFLVRK